MLRCMEGLDEILRIYNRRLQGAPEGFKRYLIDKIDWRDNLIAIKGAKGTGKTTMLLQLEKPRVRDPLSQSAIDPRFLFSIDPYKVLAGGVNFILDYLPFFPAFILRTLSPDSSMRCAEWTMRSRIASATVGSPTASYQFDTGN